MLLAVKGSPVVFKLAAARPHGLVKRWLNQWLFNVYFQFLWAPSINLHVRYILRVEGDLPQVLLRSVDFTLRKDTTNTTTILSAIYSARLPVPTFTHVACTYGCAVVSSRIVSLQLEPLTRRSDLERSASYWAANLQQPDWCPEIAKCSCGESCPRCWINFQRTHTHTRAPTRTHAPHHHNYTSTHSLKIHYQLRNHFHDLDQKPPKLMSTMNLFFF